MTRNLFSIRPLRRYTAVATAVFAGFLLLGAMAGPAQAEPPSGTGSWTLRFDEEFNSSGLNTSVWTPGWQQGGISGPMSGQCLNSGYVSQPGDGSLHLHVREQANTCGGQSVTDTGSLVESNPGDGVAGHTGFSYKYGYVEWRTWVTSYGSGKLADWPGLWSVPAPQGTGHSSEVDTMEGLNGEPCFHVHPPFPAGYGGCQAGSHSGWHTYGAYWKPGAVAFYYDGSFVGERSYSSETPEYLIMQMVPPYIYEEHGVRWVGGERVVPAEMLVDYVKVWQHPSPPEEGPGWVMRDPSTGNTNVYYVNSSHQLAQWVWTNTAGWVNATIGGSIAEGTTPFAVRDPSTGNTNVYYVNGSHELAEWYWTAATSWVNETRGGQVAAGTSPDAVRDPSTGNTNVYYVNSLHQLAQWYWTAATSWVNETL